jgi:hypothetical protein
MCGCEFVGWYTDPCCGYAWNFSCPVTCGIRLYARWCCGDSRAVIRHCEDCPNRTACRRDSRPTEARIRITRC